MLGSQYDDRTRRIREAVMRSQAPISDDTLYVPDALIPFNSARCGPLPRRGIEVVQGHEFERRAFVFAATRRRLAEFGPDKVTLRMVATDCGISVQTIFNLIGNRPQVLSEAINDYGRVIKESALRMPNFPNGLLAFIDAMWQSAARNPSYMRQACLSYRALDSEAIRCAGIRTVRALLLKEQRRFRPDIDLNFLAEALQSMVVATMADWAFGRFDLQTLRKHLAFRASLLFNGASSPDY
jgi:AcrR family transcriptional regulator